MGNALTSNAHISFMEETHKRTRPILVIRTRLGLCTEAEDFTGDKPESEFVQLQQNSRSTYLVLQIPSDIVIEQKI